MAGPFVLLFVLLSAPAQASPVTLQFWATPSSGPLVGVTGHGSLTFDPSSLWEVEPGEYLSTVTALTFVFYGHSYHLADALYLPVYVEWEYDGIGPDFKGLDSESPFAANFANWGGAGAYFMVAETTAAGSGPGDFSFYYTDGTDYWNGGDVTYTAITAIPEPGLAGCVALALCTGLVLRRQAIRRRPWRSASSCPALYI